MTSHTLCTVEKGAQNAPLSFWPRFFGRGRRHRKRQ
ncbi:hypothetical protein NK6_7205 [Bradyrhizobium diazoefficiens]|uniref:Uncharacterized protein n=1 Tax=Bradyrhizobium diazoefficiens TaxID=1355477 RepID=A0A0E4FW73_9BRAD|nr:hypothetical protein NK6_7205 [Bradyrhizobium diazoefficiens]